MSRWDIVMDGAEVPAVPNGVWTEIIDFVDGGTVLRIAAKPDDKWRYAVDRTCGPNGDPAAQIARTRCVFASAPVGSLIGKIGGSTASTSDGTVFAVGAQCVVKVGADGGPLYLTINDEESGMDAESNDGSLRVSVQRRLN